MKNGRRLNVCQEKPVWKLPKSWVRQPTSSSSHPVWMCSDVEAAAMRRVWAAWTRVQLMCQKRSLRSRFLWQVFQSLCQSKLPITPVVSVCQIPSVTSTPSYEDRFSTQKKMVVPLRTNFAIMDGSGIVTNVNVLQMYSTQTDGKGSLLLLSWLCVDNIWNLMKKIVNASAGRSVPQTSFKVKRTAAAICAGRTRKAVLRNTRYFMPKPVAVRTNVHRNPEHAQLQSQHVPGIVDVQRRREILMGHKAKKILDSASPVLQKSTALQSSCHWLPNSSKNECLPH